MLISLLILLIICLTLNKGKKKQFKLCKSQIKESQIENFVPYLYNGSPNLF